MQIHEIWWSLAIMIATTEIFFGALYFVAAGFALFCAGIAARFGASLPVQFAVATGIFGVAVLWLRRRRNSAARRQKTTE